jgi:hypothetical protein
VFDAESKVLFRGDALGAMISAAKRERLFERFGSDLVDGGITNLQYADDRFLFLDVLDISIITMKFSLYCYEAMPGMKVIFEKSKILLLWEWIRINEK